MLKTFFPEGPAIAHQTLLHPPGGVAGGDTFQIDLDVGAGTHAVLTTPAATRFYRAGATAGATQRVRARVAAGARLEWLAQEAIVHDGACVTSTLQVDLAPGAEALGWDVWALGLPASGAPWRQGRLRTETVIDGLWHDRAVLDAADPRWRRSPLGWRGCDVQGTLWWVAGPGVEPARMAAVAAALAALQARLEPAGAGLHWGWSVPAPGLLVVRALGTQAEPVTLLLRAFRTALRAALWGLPDVEPRVWERPAGPGLTSAKGSPSGPVA